MSTQAQIEANRRNAQKSTGPKTAEGKAQSAANAVKHGLCAERFAVAEQDRQAYQTFRDAIVADLSPVGQLETTLANRIASLAWRLELADRANTEILFLLFDDKAEDFKNVKTQSPSPSFAWPDQKEDYFLARVFFKQFKSDSNYFDGLALYEQRLQRSLITARKELTYLQKLRKEADQDLPKSSPSAKGQYREAGRGYKTEKIPDRSLLESGCWNLKEQTNPIPDASADVSSAIEIEELPPQSSFISRKSSIEQTNPIPDACPDLSPVNASAIGIEELSPCFTTQ